MTVTIGIDLGTTNSCVAAMRNNHVEVIPNLEGNRTMRSCVAFTKSERLVGQAAAYSGLKGDAVRITEIKRFIGRRFSDPQLQSDMKRWSFTIDNVDDRPMVRIEHSHYSAEQLSAMILENLKQAAEEYLGEPVTKAVITVPAYFNDAQRSATKLAGQIAGLDVLRIINEPTAAALAYGFERQTGQQLVLVFDLGGGTCDVSLLELDNGMIEVIATAGNTNLGGEDFDDRIMQYWNEKHQFSKKQLKRVAIAAERCKRQLSMAKQATGEVECLFGSADFQETLSRAKFEELCKDLFDATMLPIDQVLRDADVSPERVDQVILVGGSTRIPYVQQLLQDKFKKPLCKAINPDESVATGAALQAAIITDNPSCLTDLLFVDVTPLTLGVETEGGVVTPVMPRNSALPAKMTKKFTTSFDDQTNVRIVVYEGEQATAAQCNLLGEFCINGIAPAKRGSVFVTVTFEVDIDGILNVEACEGDKCKKMMIKRPQPPQAEIRRMMCEAEQFRQRDDELRRMQSARNLYDRVCIELGERFPNHRRVLKWLQTAPPADTAWNLEQHLRKLRAIPEISEAVQQLLDAK